MADLLGGRTYCIPTYYGDRTATFWGFHSEDCTECHICKKVSKRFFSFTDVETEAEITIGMTCIEKVQREAQ